MTTYKLSPSDMTFLWEGCRLCYYLKVKHQLKYGGVFPGMFTKMADLTSHFYHLKPAQALSPALPPGVLLHREKWVQSAPLTLPGCAAQVVIKGRFDAAIAFEDGSYAVVDFKTSEAGQEKVAFYSRQLSAYAYALENRAPGAFALAPISRLGLFIVTPGSYEPAPSGSMAFISRTAWMDIPRDDAAFLAYLGEVLAVLENPLPPPPAENCELCRYRQKTRDFGI